MKIGILGHHGIAGQGRKRAPISLKTIGTFQTVGSLKTVSPFGLDRLTGPYFRSTSIACWRLSTRLVIHNQIPSALITCSLLFLLYFL